MSQTRTVVIAEDEALIRMDLAEMLGEEGYDVVGQAGDGARAVELAEELACPTVVAHPPFAWQRAYGRAFVEGIAERQARTEVKIAVENMYPWRVPGTGARGKVPMYLPGWDPTYHEYAHVTLDLSHSATAHADAVAMARAAGPTLAHVHLADGSGSLKDEHLVPGDGAQPCEEVREDGRFERCGGGRGCRYGYGWALPLSCGGGCVVCWGGEG